MTAGEPTCHVLLLLPLPHSLRAHNRVCHSWCSSSCSAAQVADGVSWGEPARRAARCAVLGATQHLHTMLKDNHCECCLAPTLRVRPSIGTPVRTPCTRKDIHCDVTPQAHGCRGLQAGPLVHSCLAFVRHFVMPMSAEQIRWPYPSPALNPCVISLLQPVMSWLHVVAVAGEHVQARTTLVAAPTCLLQSVKILAQEHRMHERHSRLCQR